MVNSDDIIKRLEFLLDNYGLNASAFADKIGVQRSSISHLLSGRNKPSLDFILKVIEVFPDINLYWLLKGTGDFVNSEEDTKPKTEKITSPSPTPSIPNNLFDDSNFIEPEIKTKIENETTEKFIAPEKNSENNFQFTQPISPPLTQQNSSDIFKIVIFYKDGTFQDFNQK